MTALKVTTRDSQWQPRYFAVVVGLFCGLYMVTLAVNAKFVEIGGLVFPAGVLVFPLCAILTDLMTEVYGFNRTRQAIWTVLVATLLFAGFTQLAMLLPYPSFWENQAAFETIFASTPRLALAGCLAWLAGEFANSYIMSRMKVWQMGARMPVRFVGSTAVGQSVDTLVFALVAFVGVMPWGALAQAVAVVIGLKIGYEIVALPVSVPLTRMLKRWEGIEHFDKQELKLI